MKANKIITVVFIGLFSICSMSCSGKPNTHSQSTTEQSDTSQASDTKKESTVATTKKGADSDFFSTLLLYVSLGLNALVICVLTKQHLRQNRHRSWIANIENKLETELNRNIQMHNYTPRLQQGTSLSKYEVNRLISQYFNDSRNLGSIIDSIRRLQKLDEQERETERVRSQSTQRQNNDYHRIVLYAGSAEDATREFYSVINQVDPEKTIFELHVTNGSHAEYKVTKSAFDMVLRESAYLEVACDVYKKGSSNLINTENGIAEKQPNGKWLIIKKAKVTIE